jgi:hypothetical protein
MKKVSHGVVRKALEAYGLEPEDKGDYYRFTCPACGHREAFNYKGSPLLICSRKEKCNYSDDIYNFIREQGLVKKDILREFDKEEYREEVVKVHKDIELPEGLTFFQESDGGIVYNRAFKYLKERAIPEDNIYSLGYVYNPEGKFGFSIFVPFYENGNIMYFITRNIDGSGLRYNNPKDVDGRNFVFNYDNIEEGSNVFVFEGVFDAISLKEQVGTAMLTSNLSASQASKILEKAPKNIVFVPDNDEAGDKFLNKNIKTLNKYRPPSLDINIYIYRVENGKDFNEEAINTGKHHIYLNECEAWKANFPGIEMKRKPLL